MVQRIERDLHRFRQVVRGIVKKELRKFMVTGELVGRQGRDYVSIPIRQIEIPTFRHETRRFGGVGGPKYKETMQLIERRLAGLALYR